MPALRLNDRHGPESGEIHFPFDAADHWPGAGRQQQVVRPAVTSTPGLTMTPSSCMLMAEYNRWMNSRLYDAAAKLTQPQLFEDRGAFFGSLFDTLNHIAVADTIWLHRFASHPELGWLKDRMAPSPQPASLTQRLADSLAQLRAYRERADAVVTELAGRITEGQLSDTLRYTNTAGKPQAKRLGALVQHFFNHQTHHRGQATTLLSQAAVDVGVTDLAAIIPLEA